MSEWKEVEELGKSTLKAVGTKLKRKLEETPEELLLVKRHRMKQGLSSHLNAFLMVNLALWAFFLVIAHNFRPAFITTVFWGIGMGIHALNQRSWLKANASRILAAEAFIRSQGKADLQYLVSPVSGSAPLALPAPVHPLLTRAEEGAEATRKALVGIGPAEVDALATVTAGLERVRELVGQLQAIQQSLIEASAEDVDYEVARLRTRLEATTDADARELYRTQLEMLSARKEKAQVLRGLKERIEAYGESYILSLTNLRMDAAQIKAASSSSATVHSGPLQGAQALEKQMDGMRRAAMEVERTLAGGS